MASKNYLVILLAFTVFFATCKSDEESDKGNGTMREITNENSQTGEEPENGKENNTNSEEQSTYIANISAGGNFYAHFENEEEKITAELFSSNGSVILMLCTNNADRAESLNGDIKNKLEFNLKGITDDRGVQAKFNGKITPDNELKLKNKNTGKEYLLKQNYTSGAAFKYYSFEKETESDAGTLTDKMQLLFPVHPGKNPELESLILKHYFDKKKGNPDALLKELNKELLTEFKSNSGGGFWNREITCDILNNDNGIISYAIHSFSYLGGAHGNGASSYFVYDIKNKKQVTLSGIFGSTYNKKLSSMIYNEIKKSREFSDSEMKTEYELPIEPTDNFYITPKGLHFYYNSYEIAPYSMGPDAVFFSFETIAKEFDTDYFDNLKL